MSTASPLLLVADLGGSNTDLLLATPAGEVVAAAIAPPLEPEPTAAFLARLSAPLGATAAGLGALVVTGGRHRRLPPSIDGLRVLAVDEIEAIARGGLIAAGRERALVVSMGTGTAFVSAEGERNVHTGGVALGGGTLRGLAGRLLGTTDPAAIAALAAAGDPRGPDLTVADIVGGGAGILPGEMPAAYLARLADEAVRPEDVAAALLDMIGHIVTHMALLTARLRGQETIVLTGHMLEFDGVARAARRLGRAFAGEIVVPPRPGQAVARGALAVALAEA